MPAPLADTLDTRAAIVRDLRDSYGVEDIAVRLRISEASVRSVVSYLRDAGTLGKPGFFARTTYPRPRP